MVDNTSKGLLVPSKPRQAIFFKDIKYNCPPGGSSTVGDPHAYFSRPGSSQSMYGGRGPTTDRERKQDEEFRAKLAAMQADDDSPPSGRRLGVPSQGIVCR